MTEVHEWSYAGVPLTGVDEFGTEWSVESASGWTDGGALRSSRQVKSGQDGEWDATPLRGAREVSWIGKAVASSHAGLELSTRAFTALPVRGDAVGESEGLALSVSCRLVSSPKFEHLSHSIGVWQLSVVASDPLLYGPPVSLSAGLAGVSGTGRVWPRVWPRDWGVPAGVTPGAVAVPNAGTAAYWPTLRIDGPVVNPRVTVNETGDWVQVNRTLTSSQWLEVDCANRRVMLNGAVSLAGAVASSGRWLGIPVGGASVSFAANSADAASLLTINGFEGAYL